MRRADACRGRRNFPQCHLHARARFTCLVACLTLPRVHDQAAGHHHCMRAAGRRGGHFISIIFASISFICIFLLYRKQEWLLTTPPSLILPPSRPTSLPLKRNGSGTRLSYSSSRNSSRNSAPCSTHCSWWTRPLSDDNIRTQVFFIAAVARTRSAAQPARVWACRRSAPPATAGRRTRPQPRQSWPAPP
ncbi:hypothetical protein BC828DRAFT_224394 [Blastocladiella britannica]|nr:hypothetical protein BC828DRAFT_224394 [Blastocladiella britannica]